MTATGVSASEGLFGLERALFAPVRKEDKPSPSIEQDKVLSAQTWKSRAE